MSQNGCGIVDHHSPRGGESALAKTSWLFGSFGDDRAMAGTASWDLGVDVQWVLKVTILTWCKINHFAW
jgi:hypothetical protein